MVENFIGTTQDTNLDKDLEHPNTNEAAELTEKNEETYPKTETGIKLDGEEHENNS